METQQKSTFARKVLGGSAVGGATLAAAWFVLDPAVDWYVGDYKGEKPTLDAVEPNIPQKPEPIPAKRGPIEVAIGFDVSKSDIGKVLGSVTAETRKFLEGTDVLTDGDRVSVCKFVEQPSCKEFLLPGQKQALLSHVKGVDLDPRKPNEMHTYVHVSIQQILNQTDADIAIVWTDGQDEDTREKQELGDNHSPVVIVVPDLAYVADANSVKMTLGGRDVNVEIATTSDQFGKDLEDFTGRLNEEAQKKAEQDAKKLYQQRLIEHSGKMQKYQDDLKKYGHDKFVYEEALKVLEQQKAKLQAEIQATKNTIKKVFAIIGLGIVGVAISALSAAIAINRHEKNKPKFPPLWYIVDKRGRFQDSYCGPSSLDKPFNLNTIDIDSIILVPTKEGIVVNGGPNNGKVLQDGDEIMPGVIFTTEIQE